MREIERLKLELAETKRQRDSYSNQLAQVLPPIPDDYDFQESNLEQLLAEAIPADTILAELCREEAAS